MFPLLKFAVAGAIFALSAATHSPYAETLVALSAPTTPTSADEMVQKLGSVGPHEPLLTTVGNKRVIAFFVPGNGQCNVQAVFWNADDMEATSAGGIRVSLNPGQTASIDSAPTETFTLKCGDYAETLVALDTERQVASK
jgi:hypothetical protein